MGGQTKNTLLHSRWSLFITLFVVASSLWAIDIDSTNIDSNKTVKYISNEELLNPVFAKLYQLEKTKKGKINIVHVGDSHIQADFWTNAIRQPLQDKFGNGGLGFTFPYNILKTNGPRSTRYASNAIWQKHFNLKPSLDSSLGLSGIAMTTTSQHFVLQLTVEDTHKFNTIKVIYPKERQNYKLSVSTKLSGITKNIITQTNTTKYHKIRSGENLSIIAQRYKVTLAQLRMANGLNSNVIKAGTTLKIPVRATKNNIPPIEIGDDVDYIDMIRHSPYFSSYTSDSLLDKVSIFPEGESSEFAINGIILENMKAGLIYHSIGVNGTNLRDYNKYPLFFKQLPILAPDLIIVSLGSNESFGKVSSSDFMWEMTSFVANVKKYNPNVAILVTTPPPSLFRKRKNVSRENKPVANYVEALLGQDKLPVWNLYGRLGGHEGIIDGGQSIHLINRDRIHYTETGYHVQGEMFVHDFMEAYNNYKIEHSK